MLAHGGEWAYRVFLMKPWVRSTRPPMAKKCMTRVMSASLSPSPRTTGRSAARGTTRSTPPTSRGTSARWTRPCSTASGPSRPDSGGDWGRVTVVPRGTGYVIIRRSRIMRMTDRGGSTVRWPRRPPGPKEKPAGGTNVPCGLERGLPREARARRAGVRPKRLGRLVS